MGNGYCPNCQTNVITKKELPICKIIFWFCCGVIPGVICLIKEMNEPENQCSVCGTTCTAPH
ncbi:MAG: hypothetical protein EU530_03550 [Promethearchaeota archaeon]|nr:MAG: hypothetical protein EU530_03550 [Candidatus Lokiarchaeota archaeon]